MAMMDPRAVTKIQPELLRGESIYWAGMPNPSVVFHSDDWVAVPFSLAWGGFAIFWEFMASGYGGNHVRDSGFGFMSLWGIPFVLIGQYLIWGRFVYDGWLKRRTFYAITNRRVLVVQEAGKRKTRTIYLEGIPGIEREGQTIGTLWFGPRLPLLGGRSRQSGGWSRFNLKEVLMFADIDDLEAVYRLVLDLKEKNRRAAEG